ncbi:MAG: protein-glutamate O-methyltransferase CheR [Polyangiales bacterium]
MSRSSAPPWLADVAQLIAQRTGLARIQLRVEQLERSEQRMLEGLVRGHPAPANDTHLGAESRWDALIDEVTVRETYFFRHPEHFELVRTRVLPDMRERGLLADGLRVWSAGCASGEEPYSIAMLLMEEGLLDQSHILATDISRAALARTQAAEYREWSLRGVSDDRRQLHFKHTGAHYAVREQLKRHVSTHQLNLVEASFPSFLSRTRNLHLIFCRNVLMFFDHSTVAAVAGRLHAALVPGGWLITGPSDPNLADYAPLEVQLMPGAVFYRKSERREHTRSVPRLDALDAEPPLQTISVHPRPISVLPPEPSIPAVASTPPPDTSALVIREVWNSRGAEAALVLCARALECSKDELELHYLHGLLLWELRRYPAATRAMRCVLYLDRGHALAHFGLASIHEAVGDADAARRSYRNTLGACSKLPPDTPLPLGDGLSPNGLARAAEHALSRLTVREVTG